MLNELPRIVNNKTKRVSSWDKSGRNSDYWMIPPGQSAVLADIKGPGRITHIWMTQPNHYRHCLLKFTWDDCPHANVLVPLGDFFCLGHAITNSFQSLLFTASTGAKSEFEKGCALNCYVPMPFRKRAVVELINQSEEDHMQYFYIDYETVSEEPPEDVGYFHAEFRRANPFGGWGHEIKVNEPECDIVNKQRDAWQNNYVILQTKGQGHYLGCNLSVTNFQGTWWGEGDDMIWIDGYKWPPDLHGTGSEDYLNQAWCMQENAFLRNGASIHESNTNGYQTSYVFHVENPVRFNKEIKVTIEHGHGNHLANEMSSVAYFYLDKPTRIAKPPTVGKRMPVLRDNQANWLYDKKNQSPSKSIATNAEMRRFKARWAKRIKRR